MKMTDFSFRTGGGAGGGVDRRGWMCLGKETKLERRVTAFPPLSDFIPGSHPLSPFAPPPLTFLQLTPQRGGRRGVVVVVAVVGGREEKERKQEYQINEKFSYRPRFRAFHASNNN